MPSRQALTLPSYVASHRIASHHISSEDRIAPAGIVPYINASIVLQLLSNTFPSLKKMQREDGSSGRETFALYQKLAALAFAIAQSFGQLSYIRRTRLHRMKAWG